MQKYRYIKQALRLHTLPLSVSGILLGTALAGRQGAFSPGAFLLALLTTLGLQIISNLANDLGDAGRGTDNQNRLGPVRGLQAGVLNRQDYLRLIFLFAALTLLSGTGAVYAAFGSLIHRNSLWMLLWGGLALLAALTYTLGKKPYGYYGLGDISVFLFFGLLSTCGAYFLMRPELSEIPLILLPASGLGFFTTGVLNVNNMRDIENDSACGKNTIVVKIGLKKAKIYHFMLVTAGWTCMAVYTVLTFDSVRNLLYVLTLPVFFKHLKGVAEADGRELDPQLKKLSVATLLFCITAALGMIPVE